MWENMVEASTHEEQAEAIDQTSHNVYFTTQCTDPLVACGYVDTSFYGGVTDIPEGIYGPQHIINTTHWPCFAARIIPDKLLTSDANTPNHGLFAPRGTR